MTVVALGLYLIDTLAFAIIFYLLPSFFFRLDLTLQRDLPVLGDNLHVVGGG